MAPTECVKLLSSLIGHRTVNPGGDEPSLAAFLADQLRAVGAEDVVCERVERDGEVGAYVWGCFGTPDLLINVHLDTVPVATGWRTDPFSMTAEGDKLYGLGTADTKGAIAAVLSALARARPTDVAILFSGDEERTSSCIDAFLASPRARGISKAIVCEPTGRAMGVQHRGILAYRFGVLGVGGHSSRADITAKPLVTMARLALELDRLGESYLEVGPERMRGLCLNVANISGGVAFNVIAERAELTMSVRPPPGFDAARFDGQLGTCIRAAGGDRGAIELDRVLDRAPFATADVGAFATLLGDAPSGPVALDFWTEAAKLSAAGIDAVVIGPGDIAVAHGPDEFVTVRDLEWAEAMFASLFDRSAAP